ncbi:NAD-dependent epimerase/dehydratase family protein [Microcella humidisoli]|uniref:NAD(P)H-binding protein n=1 Tax=Microcella humidisoli TaxID=2963406 RepID=A0ABY5FU84_9MICO|nr:NAD-dependent epimerase/dehydratase family protein [Microcella humidisoli]UTT61853.1 NAD(P)H-binding protein [Microcella humidisoli]
MQKNALLVGGSGQIGSAAAHALLHAGWSVTIAHRGTRPLPAGLAENAASLPLDRADADALTAAARGHDLVLDCVAFTPGDVAPYAALAGEVGSLVVISTASVYLGTNGTWMDAATGDDDFPRFPVPVTEQHPIVTAEVEGYSPQKAAMERALLAVEGLPVTILRPGAIHGPGSPALREWYFIKRALDGRRRVPLIDRGESRFATSATAVIAELVRLAGEHPGRRVLNAVDEPAPTVLEIGQAVFAHLGHSAEFDLLPRGAGGPDSSVGQTPWSVPVPVVLSMQAAREQLGYVPLGSHRATIGPAIDGMLAAVADTDWRERFPGLTRYGAEAWFDYAAEDALLDG